MAVGWASIARSGRLVAVDARPQHGLVARTDAVDLDIDAGRGLEVGDRGSKLSPSPPIHWIWIETVVPSNGILPSAPLVNAVSSSV